MNAPLYIKSLTISYHDYKRYIQNIQDIYRIIAIYFICKIQYIN